MLPLIREELLKLETEHDIKVLYAVESGSRAWGFASVNSDWDIRYLYIHRPEWYLKIDAGKDSQEKILPNDLGLSGWELKKALRLFRKSNPPLLEWLHSPIIYSENYTLAARMRELTQQTFSPVSCMFHYLSMAKGNFREYLQRDSVRLKKYFYVLRPILACEWIHQFNNMPPVEFRTMVDKLVRSPELEKAIADLLVLKRSGEEMNEGPRVAVINDYIHEKIAFFETVAGALPSGAPNTDLLNETFKAALEEAWR